METGLEDDISNLFIANYAITVFPFLLTSLLSLIILHPILHPPLFHFFIYFSDELDPRYNEEAGQEEIDQYQPSLLGEYPRLNVPLLLRYIIWVTAHYLSCPCCSLEFADHQ